MSAENVKALPADPGVRENDSQAPTFCPQCGKEVATDDRFCRACGYSVSTAPANQGTAAASPPAAEPPDAPSGTRRRRAYIVGGLVVLLLAVGGAAAAILLSKSKSHNGPSPIAIEHAHLVAARQRLLPPIHAFMDQREAFFGSERRFLAGMTDVNRQLRHYRVQSRDVQNQITQIDNADSAQQNACLNDLTNSIPCPNPTYPSYPNAPDLGSDVQQLRSVAKRMDVLHAQLLSVQPPADLKILYAQLEQATAGLNDDATYNADTLTQAITPADSTQGDTGSVDNAKIQTLHSENALPAVAQMNVAAVALLRQLKVPLSGFDVPGGHDIDSSDHSTAT